MEAKRIRELFKKGIADNKDRLQLPHFYRRITAIITSFSKKRTIYLFLSLAIIFNLLQTILFPFSQEKRLRYAILRDPQNYKLHENLGKYYLGLDAAAARQEYLLAEELSRLADIPEAEKKESPWQKWESVSSQKQKLEQEVAFWERVRQIYPDYQYANMKLAALYFQLGQKSKVSQYQQLVIQNSPKDAAVESLLEKLK
ncbi:hypothetical protein FJY90_03270 [Candidatus Gottesmanbacteria bacterium]|nr:hypothetical protein [Candidatus Gottesmanbacteria bacterium]